MSIHQAFFGIEKIITFLGSFSTKVSGSSITLNVPSGVQNGDLLIAVVSAGGGSVNDWIQTSFTWAVEQNNSNPNLGVAYRVASSEPASYNFTTSTNRDLAGTLMLFRNAVWDQTGTLLIDGNAGSMTATGVTASKADSVLLGAWSTNNSNITISTPTGMSSIINQSASPRPAYEIFTENVPYGATGTRTSTVGGNNASAAVLWSIIPA